MLVPFPDGEPVARPRRGYAVNMAGSGDRAAEYGSVWAPCSRPRADSGAETADAVTAKALLCGIVATFNFPVLQKRIRRWQKPEHAPPSPAELREAALLTMANWAPRARHRNFPVSGCQLPRDSRGLLRRRHDGPLAHPRLPLWTSIGSKGSTVKRGTSGKQRRSLHMDRNDPWRI